MDEIDNKDVKSRRDEFVNRIKDRYPDADISNDDLLFGKISEVFDENDKALGQYKKNEESLSNLLTADPRAAAFLSGWKNGKDPLVGMVEIFGDDFREALDDPEKMGQIKEAQKKYLDRITNEQKLNAEFDGNLKKSMGDLEKYAEDNGLSDEQVEEMYKNLSDIARDYVSGIMKPETWDMIRKAMNHDSDVASAAQEAEVKAKNGKIAEAKLREVQEVPPALNGQGVPSAEQQPQIEGVLGQQGRDIWKGMKRTSRQ